MVNITLVCLLLATQVLDSTLAVTQDSAVRALVYTDIDTNSFDKCIRIMNGTKQIGCQSSLNGNVGVLFHINHSSDVQRVMSGLHHPYIVLIHADVFGRHVVKTLQSSGKVNGIIVYSSQNYTGKVGGWSPAPKCPRYVYGLYSESYGHQYANCSKPWNQDGDGLSEEDIDFPVFFMKNDTASTMILDCHDQHNLDGDYPLCAAQMNARMNGAVSTETCVRRNNIQKESLSPASYCDVMGGYNILGTLQATNSSDEVVSKPIVLVTAALDSRSFVLESTVPGANSATGFVSLLAVAQALGNLKLEERNALPYNIMFMLFNGEAFDNMGSTRMVYEMSSSTFPFSKKNGTSQPENFDLSKVAYVIEIGQVGLVKDTAWMHFDPVSAQDSSVSIGKITDSLQKSSDTVISFRNQSADLGLVPSSLQSMLKNRSISGIVITDYDQPYANKYYMSSYDTPNQLGIAYEGNLSEADALPAFLPLSKRIANISATIAKAVYNLASDSDKTLNRTAIDVDRIAQTLYCYYFNDTCNMFISLIDSSRTGKKKYKARNATVNRYVSVYKDDLANAEYMARNLLMQYIGDMMVINDTEKCKSPNSSDTIYKYLGFKANDSKLFCYRATVYEIDGRSPSAVIKEYNYANEIYPAWSESNWNTGAFKMSIFLVQDSVSQGMVLLSGLLMFLSSLAIVYVATKKSDILFSTSDVL